MLPPVGARNFLSISLIWLALLATACGPGGGGGGLPFSENPSRLLLGVGDRLSMREGTRDVDLPAEARRRGLALDLFEVWLPRGWEESWAPPGQLRALADAGTVPVLVHYFFGDAISRERVIREGRAWRSSLERLAALVRAVDRPVLVILEPEFNDEPAPGETPITSWPGFAEELRRAVRLLRRVAPRAAVGTCAGDFGTQNLDAVLGPVAAELDFLAFQEMRASTAPEALRPGYLDVGGSAVAFARYLRERFRRPLLLAYVAISTHGGWEGVQAQVLRNLARAAPALRREGVFGLVYFQLRDDPAHEGYFGPAETHFGLVTAKGREKPALQAFRALREATGGRGLRFASARGRPTPR